MGNIFITASDLHFNLSILLSAYKYAEQYNKTFLISRYIIKMSGYYFHFYKFWEYNINNLLLHITQALFHRVGTKNKIFTYNNRITIKTVL